MNWNRGCRSAPSERVAKNWKPQLLGPRAPPRQPSTEVRREVEVNRRNDGKRQAVEAG
jgi:hypothetical protein